MNAANDDGDNVPDQFIADLSSVETNGTIELVVDNSSGTYTVTYRAETHTFPIISRSSGSIVIESILPDPIGGDDRILEEVILGNKGTIDIDLTGWFLIDESGRVWSLTELGILTADETGTIQRNGMPMSLNNDSDAIRLIDPSNKEIDRFEYTSTEPNIRIITGH